MKQKNHVSNSLKLKLYLFNDIIFHFLKMRLNMKKNVVFIYPYFRIYLQAIPSL